MPVTAAWITKCQLAYVQTSASSSAQLLMFAPCSAHAQFWCSCCLSSK